MPFEPDGREGARIALAYKDKCVFYLERTVSTNGYRDFRWRVCKIELLNGTRHYQKYLNSTYNPAWLPSWYTGVYRKLLESAIRAEARLRA